MCSACLGSTLVSVLRCLCAAQALTANRTLTRLDLSRNPAITDVGAKALTDALQGNNVLQVNYGRLWG